MSRFNLTFLGATGEVTGSCYLLETGQQSILIDCGLFQGGSEADELNSAPFGFDPGSIDAIILTHAHIDHSGRLPLLVQRGLRDQFTRKRLRRISCELCCGTQLS